MNPPTVELPATRAAAIARLEKFLPLAGEHYAACRNTDYGRDGQVSVSRLSMYLRYRIITEREVIAATLGVHDASSAEKYVQEVLWRTYWKGWLELRPSVWARFLDERDRQRTTFADARAIAAAESGSTGIEGFDDWARDLVATGYLHNHARMWFASIWIFTLRLPWTLGADFFLRHLLDADAASNTLSWRWVAGLQTVGKTYLASADNIRRYTDGRFAPAGLATEAKALTEPPISAARVLPEPKPPCADVRSLLLVTHEDMHPETLFSADATIAATLVVADGHLLWGSGAGSFVASAAIDTAARAAAHFDCPAESTAHLDPEALIAAADAAGVRQIVTAFAAVGPVADRLRMLAPLLAVEGIALAQVRRRWDERFWPHATKGFFAFKNRIPELLLEEGLR